MPTDPLPASTVRRAGGCLQPVLLRGRVDHIDGTSGELLHRYTTAHETGGLLPIPCKTRRASRCPPCAEVYQADTYQLIRAGLSGGKGVPETVASHPCVFATLTAPSFGPVRVHREKGGRAQRCRPGDAARPARTATSSPARTGATGLTPGSASRCARTATTTPAPSCSTPALPSCGAASPSPCAAHSPAAAGTAWNDTGGLVFTSRWGEPLYPDTVTALMTKLINRHNKSVKPSAKPLPHARLHDLRHLHATTLLLAGVPVHVVAARLGHSDPAVTLRVYSHVLREHAAGVSDIFAQAFNSQL